MNNLICIFFGHKKLNRKPKPKVPDSEYQIAVEADSMTFTVTDFSASLEICERCKQAYLQSEV